MIDKGISYLEQANNFDVNVMFCAAPKHAVTLTKHNNQKYLYTIYCLQIIESGNYIIFEKLFKVLKRRNKHGLFFKIEENKTESFSCLAEANIYLNKFINSFDKHERVIKDISNIQDGIPAGNAILLINQWEQYTLNYFNEIVSSE